MATMHAISPETRRDEPTSAVASLACYPVTIEDQARLESYVRLKLRKISTLGSRFTQVSNKLGAVSAAGGFYKLTLPGSGQLAKLMEEVEPVEEIEDMPQTAAVSKIRSYDYITLKCDPSTLLMVATLASIEKEIALIEDIHREILRNWDHKEHLKDRSDLEALSAVLVNFKFNWDNDLYKQNHLTKVLEVKQSAEKNIALHSGLVASKIEGSAPHHGNNNLEKHMGDPGLELRDLELALYLFSFASLMEVMLSGNYDSSSLDRAIHQIEAHTRHYSDLFQKSYDLIQGVPKIQKRSRLQMCLVKGLTDSELIEQSPDQFLAGRSQLLRPFTESIRLINDIHNKPLEVLFNESDMYIHSITGAGLH